MSMHVRCDNCRKEKAESTSEPWYRFGARQVFPDAHHVVRSVELCSKCLPEFFLRCMFCNASQPPPDTHITIEALNFAPVQPFGWIGEHGFSAHASCLPPKLRPLLLQEETKDTERR